jgi:hypothetical protein
MKYINTALILTALAGFLAQASSMIERGAPWHDLALAALTAIAALMWRDTDGDGTPDVRDRTPGGGA